MEQDELIKHLISARKILDGKKIPMRDRMVWDGEKFVIVNPTKRIGSGDDRTTTGGE